VHNCVRCVCINIYIYMYIYRERESERERYAYVLKCAKMLDVLMRCSKSHLSRLLAARLLVAHLCSRERREACAPYASLAQTRGGHGLHPRGGTSSLACQRRVRDCICLSCDRTRPFDAGAEMQNAGPEKGEIRGKSARVQGSAGSGDVRGPSIPSATTAVAGMPKRKRPGRKR